VSRTGPLQVAVMAVTFGLTLLVPLQYAVLIGVGLAIVLFVAEQSNRLTVRQVVVLADGRWKEEDPDGEVRPGAVTVLQPYGSLFFASAPVFRSQLPRVDPEISGRAVVMSSGSPGLRRWRAPARQTTCERQRRDGSVGVRGPSPLGSTPMIEPSSLGRAA
jgi:MFS superfamily sulfate permease-like transporter